jgi:catabolite regulation protein CreA
MTDDKVFDNCRCVTLRAMIDDLITTEYDSSKYVMTVFKSANRCDSIGTVNDCFHTVDGDDIWCEACTENEPTGVTRVRNTTQTAHLT